MHTNPITQRYLLDESRAKTKELHWTHVRHQPAPAVPPSAHSIRPRQANKPWLRKQEVRAKQIANGTYKPRRKRRRKTEETQPVNQVGARPCDWVVFLLRFGARIGIKEGEKGMAKLQTYPRSQTERLPTQPSHNAPVAAQDGSKRTCLQAATEASANARSSHALTRPCDTRRQIRHSSILAYTHS